MDAHTLFLVLLLTTAAWGQGPQHPAGYHYSSFSGPVSGAVREISVPHAHPPQPQQPAPPTYQHAPALAAAPAASFGENYVDYVAKPDYSFAYGVEDPHTGNTQNHKETRDGDVVKGEYTVLEPDGTKRTVKYTADSKNGFQATIHNSASGQVQHVPAPAPLPSPTPVPASHYSGNYHQPQYYQPQKYY